MYNKKKHIDVTHLNTNQNKKKKKSNFCKFNQSIKQRDENTLSQFLSLLNSLIYPLQVPATIDI